jgi:hypothetical protein
MRKSNVALRLQTSLLEEAKRILKRAGHGKPPPYSAIYAPVEFSGGNNREH